MVAFVGTLATFTTIGELASMYVFFSMTGVSCFELTNEQRAPTAGGQYHWVSMLAPPSAQKSLSYATGMHF